MYCKDLRKKLMKEDVTRVLGILKIFLWIKLLQTWLLPIVSLPIQTTCFVASSIFRLFWLRKCVDIQSNQVIYVTMQRFCGLMLLILKKVYRKALSASTLSTLIYCKYIGGTQI
ncbi:uncharacterized protein LOC114305351 isoform X2 [Camellia sinensis]|uniref:uncharacterized protein LOC114305351 isoform X2 n=1 Tax=Camellia sinensis TaxID=4442 RepID=UPI00103587A6|nr:uncharacterized protein LOC114305351 isoform X2 [Camellia sinensis]